ncbi:D-2-hydroxyacid dehydrogenase [Leptospira ilyithenensis]|uniref:D-2-hydroxyacid dehydrogenase n=1 Tax=Leptospira ilyithenensis TaxID=2484901 RepID=A0A4R9LJP8_9LEPT|nr:D-2-hydroxyacid dehydrogenase [Leptospira ilyithenensis]TGN07117.1 D-2-hydroxyacid dehydrogenase [Leptospira ilyithenensis]
MSELSVFSDTNLPPSAQNLLESSILPHKIIISSKPSLSLLTSVDSDPNFLLADIAFGQPNINDILNSKKLKWIQISSAGFARYDTEDFRGEMKARGIIVTNSSSVFTESCVEHVFAFMLANQRNLPNALEARIKNTDPEWSRFRHESKLLIGQNVLILGYGSIAIRLVEVLKPFRMKITGMRRKPRGDESIPIISSENLPKALREADHIINVLPENSDSKHFFNSKRFEDCKQGAVFYNIGRGATVDQSALYESLRSGHLAAAWLDVTEPEPLYENHPLRNLKNCFITPHVAGGYQEEFTDLVRHFLDNFRRYQKGEYLLDRII